MEPIMKRAMFFLLFGIILAYPLRAEESAPAKQDAAPTETAAAASVTAAAEVPTPAVPAEMLAPEESVIPSSVPTDVVNSENLEFISGEVSEMDEASKAVTVKLYGETDNAPSDKILKVTVDANTDITDGEQDRDQKSLSAGTEVDVEYDPATNKATYIFVY